MLRRLHPDQPESFAFTPANKAWAEAQITKFPEGRQASAIIPLLWRAQEQEGWLTRPAIEHVCEMLGMAYIRGLEVATFYFMFQLQPVGSVAHIQVCGTTSCMICGAEDLMAVCKDRIAANPHELSADGKFSWEEVECLGACSNAPMAQIGKDYYEDLTAARLGEIIDELAAGKVPTPGPQNGRYAAEPLNGLSSLTDYESGRTQYNASVQLAVDIGDTVKRIDGTEVPLETPWLKDAANVATPPENPQGAEPRPAEGEPADKTGVTEQQAEADSRAKPPSKDDPKGEGADAADANPATPATGPGKKPRALKAPRKAGPDDLKRIKGVGPKLEAMLNDMGFYHYDQIAKWGADEVAWVDQNLEGFKGRVSRDNWVAQAQDLSQSKKTR
jgi:NADH-quinone oxidoreductase subunit E